jgi:hypothetical protein
MRELRAGGHPFPYPIFPEPGGLLPWATGRRAEPFFWVTRGEDPNAWPVVTAAYGFTDWQEFPGTAGELLIDVVEGRFDGGPFGVDLAARGPWFKLIDDEVPSSTSSATRSMFTSSGLGVNEFAALAEMIGPSPGTTLAVDWGEIEAFMGVPLPSDYRSFIDTYGPGTFGEIKITVPGGPAEFDMYQLLRRAIEAARAPDAIRTAPICPEPDGIIAWGETGDGWTFSWAPLFPEPDRWSIVAYTRDFLVHIGDTSFSQFLRRYAEGSPDVADFIGRNPARVAPLQFTPARSG